MIANVGVKNWYGKRIMSNYLLFESNSDDQILRIRFMYSFITLSLFNTSL